MKEKIEDVKSKLSRHKYHFLVFLLISLVPFLWLRHNLPICYWDTGYGFFCPRMGTGIDLTRYVWDYSLSAGRAMTYYHSTFFTVSVLYAILDTISFSPAFGQGILFSGIILTSLTFMYLLVLEIFRNNEDKKQIAFFSSI